MATDLVGNAENTPLLPDSFTEVMGIQGDINEDTKVDLIDAILTMHIMTRATDIGVSANICADVNGDGRIGMEEVVYIVQWVSELR